MVRKKRGLQLRNHFLLLESSFHSSSGNLLQRAEIACSIYIACDDVSGWRNRTRFEVVAHAVKLANDLARKSRKHVLYYLE